MGWAVAGLVKSRQELLLLVILLWIAQEGRLRQAETQVVASVVRARVYERERWGVKTAWVEKMP